MYVFLQVGRIGVSDEGGGDFGLNINNDMLLTRVVALIVRDIP